MKIPRRIKETLSVPRSPTLFVQAAGALFLGALASGCTATPDALPPGVEPYARVTVLVDS